MMPVGELAMSPILVLIALVLIGGIFVALRTASREMKLSEMKTDFVSNVTHELKTPLAGLLLHAEMLAEGLGDSERRSSYAATVSEEANRLGRVVSNMLDLTRLERAKPLATPSEGDLGLAVKRRVEQQRNRLEDAGVSVEIDIEEDLPPAVFDADALGQMREQTTAERDAAVHAALQQAAVLHREQFGAATRQATPISVS